MKSMRINIFVSIAALCLLLWGGCRIYAAVPDGDYDAGAVFADGMTYEGNVIEGIITVYVKDEYVNDSLKLSWHLEDGEGNTTVFENERIPLAGRSFPADIPVRIDLNGILDDTQRENRVLVLDIVDEENIYWFGLSTERKCNFDRVSSEGIVKENLPAKVVIMHDMPDVINDSKPVINAEIYFEDPQLYNESVKISYKVFNKANELISGENERYEIAFDGEKGTAQMCPDLSGFGSELLIRFDIVDEKNLYWFGNSPETELRAADIEYRYDREYEIKNQYSYIFRYQYGQLILNAVGIVLFIYLLVKLRKRLKSEQ